jgi:predicted small metal-binding protein
MPDSKCSVVLSADSDEELINVAMIHGVEKHGMKDDQQTRDMIRKAFKSGCPTCS